MAASAVTTWTPTQTIRSAWAAYTWIATGYTPDATHDYLLVSFQISLRANNTLRTTIAFQPIPLPYFAEFTENAAGDNANDNNLAQENEFILVGQRSMTGSTIRIALGRTSAGELLVAFASTDEVPLNGRFQTYTIEDSAAATPVIIPENDDSSAFNDADTIPRVLEGQAEFKVSTLSRLRTYMQQGVVVDLSNKLDRNLGNVGTVSAPGAFRNAINAASREEVNAKLPAVLAPLPNTGLVPTANRDSFRQFIHAQRAQLVLPDSTSTFIISMEAGHIVYFSDISQHYANISGQTQMLQARLILTSEHFTRAHVPKATAAELQAGTSTEYRIYTPADLVSIIGHHEGGITDYDQLDDKPIIRVPAGQTQPAATDANKDAFLADFNVGRIYRNVLHHGHDATASWRDFNTSDLRTATGNNNLTFRGTRESFHSLPVSPANHDVYYLRGSDSFTNYAINVWVDLDVPKHIRGYFTTEAQATHELGSEVGSGNGVGYIAAYDTQNVLRQQAFPRITTAYTAPVADSRIWVDYLSGVITQIQQKLQVVGTPSDGQVPKWSTTNNRWEPGNDLVGTPGMVAALNDLMGVLALDKGGTGATDAAGARTNLGLGDAATKDVAGSHGEAGAGDKLLDRDELDSRYLNEAGDTMNGLLRVHSIRGQQGGETITQFGSAASRDVGLGNGNLATLNSSGSFNPRRVANNSPSALTTAIQFLSNNTADTARWRNLEGYVQDFAGALLATLAEFSYNPSTNVLTFNSGELEEHFKGNYDQDVTYIVGDIVEHDNAQWFVHNATLANANTPDDPVATTGWSRWSGRSDWRGVYDEDDTMNYLFQTGDRVSIRGDHTYFLTGPAGQYSPAFITGYNQNESVSWTRQLKSADVSAGLIAHAIGESGGDPPEDEHSFIVFEPLPEHRLEFHSAQETREALNVDTALLSFALSSGNNSIEFTRADGNTEELTRAQLRTAIGIPQNWSPS